LIALLARCAADSIAVEGLDDQRRQRQRVGLGWVLAVGTGVGVDPADAAAVEDSTNGLRATAAAGMVAKAGGIG
jgi:beta-phosphoglucomutase-like phosphatase (HAD superfamily)